MASLKVSLLLFHAIFLCSTVMGCGSDAERKLYEGLNVYRTLVNLPALQMNGKAACFADKFADKLTSQPCNGTFVVGANKKVKLDNYPKELAKCGIDANHTTDSVVMPVCVPKSDAIQVITNYTGTQYKRYINDSRYTGVGVGSKDDWRVVILSTNTGKGDFQGEKNSGLKAGSSVHCLMSLLSGMLLYLVH